MTGVLTRRDCHGKTETHREAASAMQAETEAMWLQLRNKDYWQLPEVERRPGWILPESQRGHDFADTLTLDF